MVLSQLSRSEKFLAFEQNYVKETKLVLLSMSQLVVNSLSRNVDHSGALVLKECIVI